MLHLLLVIKLATDNAISWQTCDLHRTKNTTIHAHQTEYLNMTNVTEKGGDEVFKSKHTGSKSQFYLHIWPWSTSMTGISKSALIVDRESLVESYNGCHLRGSYHSVSRPPATQQYEQGNETCQQSVHFRRETTRRDRQDSILFKDWIIELLDMAVDLH